MQKRVRAILLIACSLAIAAVVYAELKKGYYTPEQLGTMRRAGEMEASPDATFQVSAYPAPAVDLVPGDGLQEVQIYCGTCHSTRYITMQPPLAPATWEAEVNKMNKTFGAAIAEDSTRKIILYLQSHYTPETRKQ
jgi:mono/diheme cytochrome c family protein